MPTHRRMVAAILRRYDTAARHQTYRGARWYTDARTLCEVLAAGTDYTLAQIAAVIAALSPRQQWNGNVLAATALVRAAASGASVAPVVPGFKRNRAKAWAILNGAEPTDVLGGPKVRAFWRAICGDGESVTVDVWAASAAGADVPTTAAQYAAIANAYADAAAQRRVAPRDLQAIVWLVEREHANLRGQIQFDLEGITY